MSSRQSGLFPKSTILALGTIVLWSTLAISGVLLADVPPFLLVGVALLIGGLCGLPWARHWKVPLLTLLLGVGGIFGYHFFIFSALRLAPPVEANMINYLWPLLLVVLSPVFLPHFKIQGRHVLGSVLGFLGAVLIVTGGVLAWPQTGGVGFLFAALAAVTWAVYSLMSKRVAPFPTAAVGLFCLASGLLSLMFHFVFESSYIPTGQETVIIILLGMGPMGASFYLWDRAMKLGDPRKIGSLSYLTPMLSTLWLVVFSNAKFSAVSIVAMVMILVGAAVGSSGKQEA